MPTLEERKQHLNVRPNPTNDEPGDEPLPQDYEGKMQEARQQLELLHAQKLEAERQRLEREARELRKQDFLNNQIEISERLTSAISTIERENQESKREIQELEATRKSFAAHLQKIEGIDTETWTPEKVDEHLDKAVSTLDKADDEFEQAANYFSDSRRSGVFRGSPSRGGRLPDDFHTTLMNGLAFNLPVIVLGTLALIVYLAK